MKTKKQDDGKKNNDDIIWVESAKLFYDQVKKLYIDPDTGKYIGDDSNTEQKDEQKDGQKSGNKSGPAPMH